MEKNKDEQTVLSRQKKVSFSGVDGPQIKQRDKDLLALWTATPPVRSTKQLAKKLFCDVRTVQRHIEKLRGLGVITLVGSVRQKTHTSGRDPSGKNETLDLFTNQWWRLHAEQWKIRILWLDSRYRGARRNSNFDYIDDNRVELNEETIEVYSEKSFYGKETHECEAQSAVYWRSFWHRLENEFKIILVKDRYQNIKRVTQHYERVDGDIGQAAKAEEERIQAKCTTTGKVWFDTDASFKTRNHEYRHPETAHVDADTVEPYVADMRDASAQLNDWRDNKPPLQSDIARMLAEQSRISSEIAKSNAIFIEQMASLSLAVKASIDAQTALVEVIKAQYPKSIQEEKIDPKLTNYFG